MRTMASTARAALSTVVCRDEKAWPGVAIPAVMVERPCRALDAAPPPPEPDPPATIGGCPPPAPPPVPGRTGGGSAAGWVADAGDDPPVAARATSSMATPHEPSVEAARRKDTVELSPLAVTDVLWAVQPIDWKLCPLTLKVGWATTLPFQITLSTRVVGVVHCGLPEMNQLSWYCVPAVVLTCWVTSEAPFEDRLTDCAPCAGCQ